MFSPQLAPVLQAMFNEARTSGILPMTLRQASISLLAKKDKDPILFISLSNVENIIQGFGKTSGPRGSLT